MCVVYVCVSVFWDLFEEILILSKNFFKHHFCWWVIKPLSYSLSKWNKCFTFKARIKKIKTPKKYLFETKQTTLKATKHFFDLSGWIRDLVRSLNKHKRLTFKSMSLTWQSILVNPDKPEFNRALNRARLFFLRL